MDKIAGVHHPSSLNFEGFQVLGPPSPLFNVDFVFDNFQHASVKWGGTRCESMYCESINLEVGGSRGFESTSRESLNMDVGGRGGLNP